MEKPRKLRIVRRVVLTVTVIVLVTVSYCASFLCMGWLLGAGHISVGIQATCNRTIYAPLWVLRETGGIEWYFDLAQEAYQAGLRSNPPELPYEYSPIRRRDISTSPQNSN